MTKPVRIKPEVRAHPNVRKLARAVISLAQRELAEKQPAPNQAATEGVR